MIKPEKYWPFGLSEGRKLQFSVFVLLGLAVLFFLDPVIVERARGLPEWVTDLFGRITRFGTAEWILVPALLIGIGGWLYVRLSPNSATPHASGKIVRWQRTYQLSLFVFFSTALPGLFASILKRLIGRARPVHFDELGRFHFQPFSDWTYQSIPSGHTSTMFAFATGILFVFPRLTPWAFLLAILVGISRIVLGMHFPTDVFAGFLTGVLAAYAVRNFWLSRGWLFRRNEQGDVFLASD